MVGEPEQIIGAQPGLHILESHVVTLLAAARGVADIAEHLVGGRADVDLAASHRQRLHQPPGIRLGAIAGGEAGQRIGEDVAAGQAEPVHHPGRDDQRLRGVEAPDTPITSFFSPVADRRWASPWTWMLYAS